MKNIWAVCFVGVVFGLAPGSVSAQDESTDVHDELRQFREKLVAAVIASDVETQLSLAHPNVVTMWQDGRVASDHDGLKQFLDTLGKGEERGFLGYAQEPTPLALTSVYDERFAFSHGTSVAKYELYGMNFELPNYWTATLLKENDQWKLVGYHVSGNLADNPLLTAAKKSLAYISAATGFIGLLVGLLIGRRSGRRESHRSTVTAS